MVGGPNRSEKNKPNVNVEPSYNTVLSKEAPQQTWVKQQFENALNRAASSKHDSVAANRETRQSAFESVARTRNEGFSQRSNSVQPSAHPMSEHSLNSGRIDAITAGVKTKTGSHGLNESLTNSHNPNETSLVDENKPLSLEADTADQSLSQHTSSSNTEFAQEQNFSTQGAQAETPPTETHADVAAIEQSSPVGVTRKRDEQKDTEGHHGADTEMLATLALSATPIESPQISMAQSHSESYNAQKFATIDQLWRHIENMDARSGPKQWQFELQEPDSPLVSVTLASGKEGGWVVSLSSTSDSLAASETKLSELKEKFSKVGAKIESVVVIGESGA